MKITEVLEAEHRVMLTVFDQIERVLPSLTTIRETATLARIMEGMLEGHAQAETDLAFLALDQVLEEKGQLDRLHEEHHEIDASLRRVHLARSCAGAKRLLKTAIASSRHHFVFEEREVFPLLNRVVQEDTLAGLAAALKQRAPAQPPPS
jgi:type II secretory pathway component PulJ